ncbi:MAG: lytic transglycosylase domain-containing protein [Pseudomonadota bacterium]|nr:lytic transglycosylase domain-containing protein [Pseudomonadota bacterium]
MRFNFCSLLFFLLPLQAQACWDDAAARYGVAPELLRAVARVESSLNADALNLGHVSRTHSFDIGLMQINSRWLPTLSRYGIDAQALRDPCTNIQVGAWLLADVFRRYGVSWEAVGAYNAACTTLKGKDCQQARMRYAWRVYRALKKEGLS